MRVENVAMPVERLTETESFRQVLVLWERLRGDRFAPPWRMLDLVELPTQVLPYLTVVDVRSAPEDYVYRLWGTGHTTIKGADLTGKSVMQYKRPDLARIIFDEFREVVASRRPLGFRHDVMPQPDRLSLYQDTLRLPLSADGESVTQILSYADWRNRGDEWRQLFGTLRQVC